VAISQCLLAVSQQNLLFNFLTRHFFLSSIFDHFHNFHDPKNILLYCLLVICQNERTDHLLLNSILFFNQHLNVGKFHLKNLHFEQKAEKI